MDGILNVDIVVSYFQFYQGMVAAYGLLLVIRLFTHLQFHERLSMITQTLSTAAVHIVHFVIMLSLILLLFAFIAYFLFGSRSASFSDFETSFTTVVRIAINDFSTFPLASRHAPSATRMLRANNCMSQRFVLMLRMCCACCSPTLPSATGQLAQTTRKSPMRTPSTVRCEYRLPTSLASCDFSCLLVVVHDAAVCVVVLPVVTCR